MAQELSVHKRPREVRIVDALPRNAMGKVLKKQLLTEAERAACDDAGTACRARYRAREVVLTPKRRHAACCQLS